MPGKYYSKELKEEVVSKIKTEGITAVEASKRYGIDVNNIYRWISVGVGGAKSNVLEINRLKRENQELKALVGELLFEKERGKKN